MASIKVLLFKKKKTDSVHPIAVRIIKDRKPSYIYTGQYIEEKHWDEKNHRVKKSHPNSTRLNNFIAKKLAEANDKLLELEGSKERVTAQNITEQVKTTHQSTSYFELAKTYTAQLEESEKYSRVNTERPRIKYFREFLKGRDITFPEITEVLLRKFMAYLKVNRGNSDRTIVNNLIVIRTIFNLAIREGIVERKYYPFGKGSIIIKFPQSIKLGLSSEELTALEEIDLADFPSELHARNVWLFSFYFAGMRISDVLKLKWSDFKNGRLYYQMGKNNKALSLKVADKALAILKVYEPDKSSNDDFIFPELKKADPNNEKDIYRKVSNGTKVLNKHLKRVAEKLEFDKPLTTHIARHTFGNISGDRIPVQMLQKLYRHSDITTTINYQKAFIFKDADEALDAVLNS